MVRKGVCKEYIVTRQLKDFDGKPKYFTFYPGKKGGKPSGVFKSMTGALKFKDRMNKMDIAKKLRIGCYTGKKSKKYKYLDRY